MIVSMPTVELVGFIIHSMKVNAHHREPQDVTVRGCQKETIIAWALVWRESKNMEFSLDCTLSDGGDIP